MKSSIGFIEYRSVARGLEATDAMLKNGTVELVQATVLCPGKFVSMVTGDIGAVESAVKRGIGYDPTFAISSFVIPNVHPSVLPALTATTTAAVTGALGIIETIDASSAVVAGDTAAKNANINLLEIRLARGMGGKGFVFLCGELTAVQTAVRTTEIKIGEEGLLIATSVIASPHPDLKF
ncbi:BMC domain protein [Pelotomaculum schinkii]|uniref:BMC domain protein n=1 Tax=Pelotomaculum schinkii TaxID=78350 RepID=A0A4Y7R9F1_9FIRM|nr:BMC domain-containing protein [Pelotomaculum schinkii]TEB05427.1 BMC domain protein [Pelotomaculum schinkii]